MNDNAKNELLSHALKYAERGWTVFPTREVESEPFFSKKKNSVVTAKPKSPYIKSGFLEATTDFKTIENWWKKYPNAGIGISCGSSGLVVVDIDVRGGKRGFENYMSLHVSDAGALHSVTPSGGLHIVYKGNTNSYADLTSGVDIRSRGAYFVAPPSWIIEDGRKKAYVAVDDWDKEPVEVPSSLLEKLNALRSNGKDRKKSKFGSDVKLTKDKLASIKRALDKMSPKHCDDRWAWITVGMALKTIGDDDIGFQLWDEWSSKSSKYNPGEMRYLWEGFSPKNVTIGTIFYLAYKDGKNGK